jgi:trypsin
LILRHDRPDADSLAEEGDWPAIVSFFGGDGAATLVAERWLLTAGHTAANIPPEHCVAIAGGEIRITRVVAHPDGVDLALVELERAVPGVEPIALYGRDDELGTEVVLLGRGDFGNGCDGVLGADQRLRRVTNRISGVTDDWLQMSFDRPPGGTALEGVCGEGDSGGPALLELDGALAIAGVSSWQDHDGPLGTYGCVEHYARVSSRRGWIRAICGLAD